MSKTPSVPPPSAKTELETVVNWPLLAGAASAAGLLVAVPLVLACVAALKERSVQEPIATLSAAPRPQAMKVAPAVTVELPTAQSIKPHPTADGSTPRQIYTKAVQPSIPLDPTPVPKAIKTLPSPAPALNPILQVREARKPSFKRLEEGSESYLLYLLAKTAKDVDLESVKGTCEKLLAEARKDKEEKKPPILALRAERPDLKGLPMREGKECQADPKDVNKMQEISRTLRRNLDRTASRQSTIGPLNFQRAEVLQSTLRSSGRWFQDDGLSTLAQMLQVEDIESRGEFVKRLAQVRTAKASLLLAQQALFDLSWPVREGAVQALKDRPREEYRQVLLDGLRHPWPPVAAHAAEALAALSDREAVNPLADMLDEPDPCAPARDKNNKWVVAEVVRVNHLRNCLLCHAVSTARNDPLRVIVPTPGQPLRRTYYSGGKGDFVRADITYLRQDFSVMELVADPDKWPEWQRFDYLVRTREATADELAAYEKKMRSKSGSASNPQRDAVRFALRELTGRDAGESSADWHAMLRSRKMPTPSP